MDEQGTISIVMEFDFRQQKIARVVRMKKKYIPVVEKIKVVKRDGFNCYYCGSVGIPSKYCIWRVFEVNPRGFIGRRSNVMHFDHMISESKGGPTSANNLVLACAYCNYHKGASTNGQCSI